MPANRPRSKYRIELFRSQKDRQHYWRLRASNGNVLATSEGYKRADSRNRVAKRMQKAFTAGAPVSVIDLTTRPTH